MDALLKTIKSPVDLQKLSKEQLQQLAAEMRDALCSVVQERPAHFASNLGVVELCLALHTCFDFREDRLIWDTGHQIYPQKLITGRYDQFHTMRLKGGLMGFPNPNESEYDLFMTGHAGCSISTALGLKLGDDLMGKPERHSVAVIGDGAFPSGIVYEAVNNAAYLRKPLIVILNDNKMSICPRVGGVGEYLDRLRLNSWYTGFKSEAQKWLQNMPDSIGQPTEKFITQLKDSMKAGLFGGMLFEEMGFTYFGPIDGHNLEELQKYLELVKHVKEPVLLHVVTEKGHGFQPAEEDPVAYHAPSPFKTSDSGIVPIKKKKSRAFTNVAADAIYEQMAKNDKVTVMTAAMCQGTGLGKVREDFPKRFFDTGICEAHTVAFAAGMAKAGMRPIVDIYSTFLQRSFDHIFQEVALQNLPVTFMLDRAGLTGPDGATHHGVFDLGYMRMFPNMVVMAPCDETDLNLMLDFSLQHDSPTSIRYPKEKAETFERAVAPIELGKAEVFEWGTDGCLIAAGHLVEDCLKAAEELREQGLDVGVINARFIKPLDTETILRAVKECSFVITVEENVLMTGFGGAVLEACNDEGLETKHIRRMGIPDRYIEHGSREELFEEIGLNTKGIVKTALALTNKLGIVSNSEPRQVG